LDQVFGARQKDENGFNTYFCFAYEEYVNSNLETIEGPNVDTILEFMQVPQMLFNKQLFTFDKKGPGASMQLRSQAIPFNMQAIMEENEDDDLET